jgi:dihydrofolate synthase/folylpolyglutamate synthase
LNYEGSIDFLQSRIKFGIRPGTERVAAMMEALGEPQKSYPVLHVSGTNAKFSVVAIATAILTELGMTIGTYTSPDLGNVRERIGFAAPGETWPIDEDAFAERMNYLRPYIELVEERLGEQLTYFELLTVLAFEVFFDRAVHAAVIETGLGGEYDATNVADASVAVVTNVSLDHIRQFGGDLAKAAWEKAGIAKAGTVVVTGVEQDDLFGIVSRRALEKGAAEVLRLDHEIEVLDRQAAVGGQAVTIRTPLGTYEPAFLALFGEHQARNAALAVAACESFIGGRIDQDALDGAFHGVQLPARLEILGRHPLVVVDGGHNPAAASNVRAAAEEAFAHERLILVIGMVDSKPIEDVIAIWAPIVDHAVVTVPKTERTTNADRLVTALRDAGLAPDDIDVINDVGGAVDYAINLASDDDLVLVFGSFYTASEARDWLRSKGAVT